MGDIKGWPFLNYGSFLWLLKLLLLPEALYFSFWNILIYIGIMHYLL